MYYEIIILIGKILEDILQIIIYFTSFVFVLLILLLVLDVPKLSLPQRTTFLLYILCIRNINTR